jgi:hypothetical protein
MNATKIQLSEEELSLVSNAGWILTKNAIIQKLYELFGQLALESEARLRSAAWPAEVKETSPKISKGENYRGLPYVVLDYPRLYKKQEVFAVRTLFWWAQYFSITLHLKGAYQEMFARQILKNIDLFEAHDFYVCIAKDEWLHDLDQEHYISLEKANREKIHNTFLQHPFIKLSAKIPLSQWNRSASLLAELFGVIMRGLE